MKVLDTVTVCIYCGQPLSKWERIRSYCWDCNELTASEVYEDSQGLHENEYDDNWYTFVF
jgi:predicted amidophosphoribosyltransferase